MLLTMGLSSPIFAATVVTATSVEVLLCIASIDRYVRLSPRCCLSARLPPHKCSSRDASSHLRSCSEGGGGGGGGGVSGRIPALEDFNSWDRSGGLDAACGGASAAARALCAPVIYISALYWALMAFDMVRVRYLVHLSASLNDCNGHTRCLFIQVGNTTVLDPVIALWAPTIVVAVPLCFQGFTVGFRLLSGAELPQESVFTRRARRTGVKALGVLKTPLLSFDDERISNKELEMTSKL